MSLSQLVALLILFALIRYLSLWSLRSFPPGPRGVPFLGAFLSMPKEKEWLTYTRWSKKYGDIIGLNVLGRRIVVLNTPELVTELLESRGAKYSDRPRIPMLEMIGLSQRSPGLMPYGRKLRTSRKLLLQALSPNMLKIYAHVQEREVYQLLHDLLKSPQSFYRHIERTSGAIMMSIFLGHQVKTREDEYLVWQEEHIASTSRAGSFSTHLVNTFPSLKYFPAWFPGAGFQREVKEARILCEKIFELPMRLAKQRQADGKSIDCFMTSIIEKGENVDEGQAVAATSYTAGAETTSSTLATFFLAMTLNPGAQRKARDEITREFGTKGLPSLQDKDAHRLPFVEALIKEVHRWNPPGNLAVPHCLTEADTVKNYSLPAGTIVLPNIWAILHDENHYPRPFEFRPERYIEQPELEDPRNHIFGYGRRQCPGRNLAANTLWLTVVTVLSVFNITPDIDGDGSVIPVTAEYTSGVMSRPKDFRCRISPREGTDSADRVREALKSLKA